MEYSNKCFGQALKEIMKDNKIKSRSLASKTNLDFSYFSKLKPAEYFLEYRVHTIKKLLLNNPDIVDNALNYVENLINKGKLKVAERKTQFTKK